MCSNAGDVLWLFLFYNKTHVFQVIALEGGRVRASGKLRDMELIDGVVTGIDSFDTRGKTARERWQLVKLVSKIGHHIRQQNIKFQVLIIVTVVKPLCESIIYR